MARNTARKLGDLAAVEVDEEQEKKFAQGANLMERGNVSKGGRPKVDDEDKADKPMTVYFTTDEKQIMKKYCSRISFSALVKQLLQEKGILQ